MHFRTFATSVIMMGLAFTRVPAQVTVSVPENLTLAAAKSLLMIYNTTLRVERVNVNIESGDLNTQNRTVYTKISAVSNKRTDGGHPVRFFQFNPDIGLREPCPLNGDVCSLAQRGISEFLSWRGNKLGIKTVNRFKTLVKVGAAQQTQQLILGILKTHFGSHDIFKETILCSFHACRSLQPGDGDRV